MGLRRGETDAQYRARRGEKALEVSQEERASGWKSIIKRGDTKYGIFESLLMEQYNVLISDLMQWDFKAKTTCQAWDIKDQEDLKAKATAFKTLIRKSLVLANKEGITDKENNPIFYQFRHAFVHEDLAGLQKEMRYAFIHLVVGERFGGQNTVNQKKLADLRYPIEWFPATRAIQRTIHLHVGPTNSGKTYHALKRLESAKTGIYAGPLRLLAHEIYTRMNAKGRPCALITGEERRFPEDKEVQMSSCTVEMVPLNHRVEVAVIDEIQMIADENRGWAWTSAFLGVMATEVHLCGELRTVPLIRDLCAAMGDKLEIHEYKRLSPLEIMGASIKGDLTKLQKGDAIILFSRVAIHAMKKKVEEATGRRCAVVYGSLPPETRAQQANLFNDPNNDYDYLVASDAIGMGLNLSIKRIIFESTSKHNGQKFSQMGESEIKQIAGRAGRYKTAREAVLQGPIDITDGVFDNTDAVKQIPVPGADQEKENVGYVTTLEKFDLPIVRTAMQTEVEPIKSAGIFPPVNVITRFASYFPPKTPFSYILLRLHDISTLSPHFHLCRLREQLEISDLTQPLNLSIQEKIILMAAPSSLRDPGLPEVTYELAECIANQSTGHILDLKNFDLNLLEMEAEDHQGGSAGYLRAAEALHKSITLYLWLSYRFAGVFQSQALAFHIKELIEERIDKCLKEVRFDDERMEKRRQVRARMVMSRARNGAREEARKKLVETELHKQILDSEGIAAPNSKIQAVS